MALESLITEWSGSGCRHIPDGSPFGILDFRFAGRSRTNRWNAAGEPTLYLASDVGVALAEFARHYDADRSITMRRESTTQRIYTMAVTIDRLLNLCDVRAWQELSLQNAPCCFLDKSVARATAQFIRRVTPAQGILVPSMAFLDDPPQAEGPARWVLALFLDKLPNDPHAFLTDVQPDGVFHLDAI